MPQITLTRVAWLSPLPPTGETTPNYSLNPARSGSDSSTASTSPLLDQSRRSAPFPFCPTLNHFHEVSRAAGPGGQFCYSSGSAESGRSSIQLAVPSLPWANDRDRQAQLGGTVPLQLLRYFVVRQPVAKRRLASGTSAPSCVRALRKGTLEEYLKRTFEAKPGSPSSPVKGLRTSLAFGSPDQTTKAAFRAHRPRPPQTPAPSF